MIRWLELHSRYPQQFLEIVRWNDGCQMQDTAVYSNAKKFVERGCMFSADMKGF